MLARALDLPPATQDWFDDDDGSAFEADINRLAEAGIIVGLRRADLLPRPGREPRPDGGPAPSIAGRPHRKVEDMHERHRRSRSLLVSLLVLVGAGDLRGGAGRRRSGAVTISLQQGRRRAQVADPDHQRERRHGPAVRRRAARHDPRRSRTASSSPATSWTSARRSPTAASAGCSGSPSTRTSRRTAGSSSTTRATAATSWCRGSRPTQRGTKVSASTAKPLLLIEHSAATQPQRRLDGVRARAGTCSSASATAAAPAIRATTPSRSPRTSSARSCGST